jgi:hypothetical protein
VKSLRGLGAMIWQQQHSAIINENDVMKINSTRLSIYLLVLLLLACVTSVLQAQRFRSRGAINPYNPYGYSSQVRHNAYRFAPLAGAYGNYLYGAASIVDAQVNAVNVAQQGIYLRQMLESQSGQSMGDKQQEQPPQAAKAQGQGPKKGKAAKQVQYEQMITAGEELKEQESTTIHRLLTNPLPSEITSGYAMNALLPYLASLVEKGVHGPQIPLDQDELKYINVTKLTGTANTGNAGLLRNGGRLRFPDALKGESQQRLEKLLPVAVSQAVESNRVDPALLADISKAVDALDQELRQKNRSDEIEPASYLEAKRFLDNLRAAVTLLQSPDPGGFLNGTVAAKGNNVQELIQSMMAENLRFAPATPGTEGAYFDLYRALVAFAKGSNDTSENEDSSFRLRIPGAGPVAASKQR